MSSSQVIRHKPMKAYVWSVLRMAEACTTEAHSCSEPAQQLGMEVTVLV